MEKDPMNELERQDDFDSRPASSPLIASDGEGRTLPHQRRSKQTARKRSAHPISLMPQEAPGAASIAPKKKMTAKKRPPNNDVSDDGAAMARPAKTNRRGESCIKVNRRQDGLDHSEGAWYVWRGQASKNAAKMAKQKAEEKAEELISEGTVAAPKSLKASMVSSSRGKAVGINGKKGGGFWFNLPSAFGDAIGSKGKRKIILVYDDGNGDKEWEVVNRVKDKEEGGKAKSHGFSGGWVYFSVDNKLFPGDSVVLEREDDDRVRVHIFRASDYGNLVMPGADQNGSSPAAVATPAAARPQRPQRILKKEESEEEEEESEEEEEEEEEKEEDSEEEPPYKPADMTYAGLPRRNRRIIRRRLPLDSSLDLIPMGQVKKEPVDIYIDFELIEAARAHFPQLRDPKLDDPPLALEFDDPPFPSTQNVVPRRIECMNRREAEGTEEKEKGVSSQPIIKLLPPAIQPPPASLGNELAIVPVIPPNSSAAAAAAAGAGATAEHSLFARVTSKMLDLEEANEQLRIALAAMTSERDEALSALAVSRAAAARLDKKRSKTKNLITQLAITRKIVH